MITLPIKLLRLDELSLAKHADLERNDQCYYWREYSIGKDYTFGETNNLINNFKKRPSSEKHCAQYKADAIEQLAQEFTQVIVKDSTSSQYTFIPIPGSRMRGDPDYDDRLLTLLNRVAVLKKTRMDIRDLIIPSQNTQAAHTLPAASRLSISELQQLYRVNPDLLEPQPKAIIIVDDVLTKGSHFKAVQQLLQQHYPQVSIVGLFIARAINSEVRT